ncbi:MAG: TRAP transporter substrate-binding protein DctP [Chloroflexi bacterium]|nr:TRAP transporter substrate-binding protein DctP [Chloroflexota bacterium]
MGRKRTIRAMVSVLTMAALLLGVFGCATPAPAPTTPAAKPAPATTPAPAPAPAKTYTLKVGGYGGATYPLRIMMEEANKMIEERSKGQFKIQWFPQEGLVKMRDMYTAIPDGVLDIGITSATYKEALGLPSYVWVLPLSWDLDTFQAHYRDPGSWFDFQQPFWEKQGLRLLSQGTLGYLQLASRAQIHTLADFKGKLFRVAGLAPAVKALGGEPVDMATAEIYEALQRGTIDGSVDSFSTVRTLKLPEVVKYFTEANMSQSSLAMVMGTKIRQQLPAELVKLIDEVYLEAERNHNARLKGLMKDDVDAIKKYPGVVEIYQLPDAERAKWKDAVKSVANDAAKKAGADWQRFEPIWKSLSK